MMRVFLIFSLCTALVFAKPRVCLNMIVKDEQEVIVECLESVKPLIDYWVICDTGSTDQTKDKIQECLKDVPGELHVSEWVNFAHNRNDALEKARDKADYLLFIDADEKLVFQEGARMPLLEKDCYLMTVKQKGVTYRKALVKACQKMHWEGVLHEQLVFDQEPSMELLQNVINVSCQGKSGRCQVPDEIKYFKDALILEEALKKEPDNELYRFYLGVSYLASNHYDKAIEAFKKRIELPSEDEELTFWSLYNCGQAYKKNGNIQNALEYYFLAHTMRPIRAEPLFNAAQVYRQQNKPLLAYLLTEYALKIPFPAGEKMVDHHIYDQNLWIEYSQCALLIGKYKEGLKALEKLLKHPNLPEAYLPRLKSNYEWAKSKLGK